MSGRGRTEGATGVGTFPSRSLYADGTTSHGDGFSDMQEGNTMKIQARWCGLMGSAALVIGTAACAAQSGSLGGAAVPAATSYAQVQPPADPATTDGTPPAAAGDGTLAAGVPISDDMAAAQPAPVDAAVDPNAAPTIAPVSPVVVLPTGFQIAGFVPGPGCPAATTISSISYGRISIEFLDKFGVLPNQGRAQCTAQLLVTVPAHTQFTLADYKQNYAPPVPLQAGQAMFTGRLNGSTSKALVDFSWAIPAAPPVTLNRAYNYTGGSVGWNNTLGDFVLPANTVLPFSACSSQATTQTIALTIDLAAASNYVIPWPPQPFAQNERLMLNAIRIGAKWQAC